MIRRNLAKFRMLHLRSQVLVVANILLIFNFAWVGFIILSYEIDRLEDFVEQQVWEKTEIVAGLAKNAMADDQVEPFVERIKKASELSRGLVQMQLKDNFGGMVYELDSPNLAENPRTIEQLIQLHHEGTYLGSCQIQWSYWEFAIPQVKRMMRNLSGIFLFGCLVMGGFVYFIQKFVTSPLEFLDKKIHSITDDPTDILQHGDLPNREVQNIEDSLDQMAEVMQERAEKDAQIKAAEDTAKAKMAFLSMMSHEIRTPLGAMLGYGQLLAQGEHTEEQREHLNHILSSGEFLLQIINDILDLSRIETEGIELEPRPFLPKQMITELINMVRPIADSKGLDLVLDIQLDEKQAFIGDAHRLKQVMMNIVGNAIKFTETGSVEIELQLIDIDPAATELRFAITDTGVGMSEEQMGHIFDPFSQADNSVSRKFGGSGLGLAICKNLVNKMGGEIEVASEPAVGSTFSFSVDAPTTDEAPESSSPLKTGTALCKGDPEPPKESKKSNPDLQILVAEDQLVNRRLISKVLTNLGYAEPIFAKDGRECDHMLNDRVECDVIFLDVHMPGLDGTDIARKIVAGDYGKRIKKTPVAMMSADLMAKKETEEIGISDFISKPVDFECLKEYLDDITPKIRNLHPRKPEKKNLRILVVDDQPVIRNLMDKFLSSLGYQADFAEDGVDCIEKLSTAAPYDLMFLDLRMPRMDGFAVAKEIRSGGVTGVRDDLPIAVVSAEIVPEEDREDLGADDFIQKPFSLHELRSFINSIEAPDDSLALPS